MDASAAVMNYPRRDARDKLAGRTRYTVDRTAPRMLHAAVLRSEVASACIVVLDVSAAEAMPGVRAVIPPRTRRGCTASASRTIRCSPPTGYATTPTPGRGSGGHAGDRRSRPPGDPRRDRAAAGGRHHGGGAASGRAAGASRLEDLRDPVRGREPRRQRRLAARSSAATPMPPRARRRDDRREPVPRRAAKSLSFEPRAAIATYEDGRFHIESSTQVPWTVRNVTARVLQVPPSSVRVTVPPVGGGFGLKFDCAIEPFAALLARKSGRPVKLVNPRLEEMLTCLCRENAELRIRSAVAKDGEILAREAVVLIDGGCGGAQIFLTTMTAHTLLGNYRLGAVKLVSRAVYTNTAPDGKLRACNGVYNTFALEQHTDEIAARLGMDRLEFRRRNVLGNGDLGATGQVFEGDVLGPMLDKMAAIRASRPSCKPAAGDRSMAAPPPSARRRVRRPLGGGDQSQRRRQRHCRHVRRRDRLRHDGAGGAADRRGRAWPPSRRCDREAGRHGRGGL